jgi:predicted nucleic acid-binding protein
LARAGSIQLVTCAEILEELDEKLQAKLAFSPGRAATVVADLLSVATVVTISGNLKVVVADPDDDKIIECAVVGSAKYIVMGDRRHLLPMKSYRGIEIVTAAEFVALAARPSAP